MEWLTVKNWSEYQHYKDRCPPWIKLHTKILNDRDFASLSCASRGLLVQLWILASENDGKVPNDLSEIRFRLRDKSIQSDDVNLLISKRFLKNCKHPLAEDSICSPETETETEKRQRESKSVFGAFKNVKLTEQEKAKLDDKLSQSLADTLIEELSEGIASKGYKYKDHYATILSWARRKGYGKPGNDSVNDNIFLRPLRKEAGKNAGG